MGRAGRRGMRARTAGRGIAFLCGLGHAAIKEEITGVRHVQASLLDIACGGSLRCDRILLSLQTAGTIDRISLLTACPVDITGQSGYAADQSIIHIFSQKISMEIIRMKYCQFFPVVCHSAFPFRLFEFRFAISFTLQKYLHFIIVYNLLIIPCR